MITTDVFIAGGGPAGLVAAIAARRRGLRVTVADGARPEVDKACGEGLMPDALASLARLGVELDSHLGQSFHGIRFLGHGRSVEARFDQGAGLGVRRTVLHGALVRTAEAAGVRLLWSTPVTPDGASLLAGAASLRARYIVGADGGNSAVRRWARLDTRASERLRYGFRRHYRITPWSDHVEVYWTGGGQIYVTPVAPDMVCVASLARVAEWRVDRALACVPELAARLKNAAPASTERGAISASRQLRRVTSKRTALIGDASGSVDAVTGEGLCLAFRQADALAEAMARDELGAYQRAHERIRRRPARMASLLLLLDRREALRRRVLAALESRPAVFGQMLTTHVGEPHPLALAATLVSLGWSLVTI